MELRFGSERARAMASSGWNSGVVYREDEAPVLPGSRKSNITIDYFKVRHFFIVASSPSQSLLQCLHQLLNMSTFQTSSADRCYA